MSQRLNERVALVTGGGSGIGLAIAERFAAEGAAVAVVGRDRAEIDEAAEKIRTTGGRALAVEADVSDEQALARAVNQTLQKWSRLDIVVANAGINGVWAPIDELTSREWRETIDINLTGTFLTLRAATPALKKYGGAMIVVSSVNGNRIFSNAGASAYATSKAGQVALTKMLALELAKHKIRVNALCPGAITTPIFDKTIEKHRDEAEEPIEFPRGEVPLNDGNPGEPEQVAAVALFFASDESSHVTGTVCYIDGGESLLRG